MTEESPINSKPISGELRSTWQCLIEYRVVMYFAVDDHKTESFMSLKQAKKFAKKMAKKNHILCRVYAIYSGSTYEAFKIDRSRPYDGSLGLFSWIFLILGILLVACGIILPVFDL